MRSSVIVVFAQFLLVLLCCSGLAAKAQRHSFGSAPPTAPIAAPPKTATVAPVIRQPGPSPSHVASSAAAAPVGPIAPVSSGLGAIQFLPAASPVPAPQTLTRQLFADDERARAGALSSLGVPGEYLVHGRVPFPHSIQLDLVQLGSSEDLDALLTVELDQHVVNAVLVPDGGGWRRVATVSFASAFSTGTTTPASFVRPLRSWVEPNRYRAVYHATVNAPNGDSIENEADVRVMNGRATLLISFVSGARQCDTTGQVRPPHQSCELTQRWLEPDAVDPSHRLVLVTGVGHSGAHDASDPLSSSRSYRLTRLRSFACQPFVYQEAGAHFEPTANSAPCPGHEPATNGPHPDHPGADHGAATDHSDHGGADKSAEDKVAADRAKTEPNDHP